MGMRTAGQGCILADDMGLGKTVQAVALIWTLLSASARAAAPRVATQLPSSACAEQNPYQGLHGGVIDRAMIVCPVTVIKVCTSSLLLVCMIRLVCFAQNWSAEIRKWLGRERMRVYVADSSHPVSTFTNNKSYDVLIIGYDKVSCLLQDRPSKLVTQFMALQMRASIDDIRYAQPPIGLIVCDEGPSG